jgi:hypothetical protein
LLAGGRRVVLGEGGADQAATRHAEHVGKACERITNADASPAVLCGMAPVTAPSRS